MPIDWSLLLLLFDKCILGFWALIISEKEQNYTLMQIDWNLLLWFICTKCTTLPRAKFLSCEIPNDCNRQCDHNWCTNYHIFCHFNHNCCINHHIFCDVVTIVVQIITYFVILYHNCCYNLSHNLSFKCYVKYVKYVKLSSHFLTSSIYVL